MSRTQQTVSSVATKIHYQPKESSMATEEHIFISTLMSANVSDSVLSRSEAVG